jgi:hypothetical protein
MCWYTWVMYGECASNKHFYLQWAMCDKGRENRAYCGYADSQPDSVVLKLSHTALSCPLCHDTCITEPMFRFSQKDGAMPPKSMWPQVDQSGQFLKAPSTLTGEAAISVRLNRQVRHSLKQHKERLKAERLAGGKGPRPVPSIDNLEFSSDEEDTGKSKSGRSRGSLRGEFQELEGRAVSRPAPPNASFKSRVHIGHIQLGPQNPSTQSVNAPQANHPDSLNPYHHNSHQVQGTHAASPR